MVSAWWASGLRAPTLIAEHDEAADDVAGGFDLVEREWRRGGADAELVARDGAVGRRAGERGAVAGEGGVGVARGVDLGARLAVAGQDLDLAGDARREEVHLAVGAEPGETRGPAGAARGRRPAPGWRARRSRRRIWRSARSASVVRPGHAAAVGKQRATTDGVEIDDIDQRAADVRGDGADAHPGEGLAQAGLERGDQAGDGVVGGQRLGAAGARKLGGELDGEARLDGGRPDREDHGHRVDVEDVDRADRDIGPAAQAGGRERGVDGTDREDRRDRQPVDRPAGVGDEDDRGVATGRGDGVGRETLERSLQPGRTRGRIPGRVERPDACPRRPGPPRPARPCRR